MLYLWRFLRTLDIRVAMPTPVVVGLSHYELACFDGPVIASFNLPLAVHAHSANTVSQWDDSAIPQTAIPALAVNLVPVSMAVAVTHVSCPSVSLLNQ